MTLTPEEERMLNKPIVEERVMRLPPVPPIPARKQVPLHQHVTTYVLRCPHSTAVAIGGVHSPGTRPCTAAWLPIGIV